MDSFLTFINQQNWDLKTRTTLLAVSGGVDSVVLAYLFYSQGFKSAIAHCNFGLRGEDSEGDEAFVRELAERYGVEFFTKRFDIKAYKDSHAVSTQMAARDLRYEWFEEIKEQNDYQYIATAHHINDAFETVILNLTRGTGIAGLKGITGSKNNLIRPLLKTSRQEILDYAEANGLKWREDSSNDSDDYGRNVVRHKVMPVLKELNPSLERTFLDTSERISAANLVLLKVLDEWKEKHLQFENRRVLVPVKDLLLTYNPAFYLWEIVQDFGFNYQQSQNILLAMNAVPGKIFESKTNTLLCDRDTLIISKKVQGVYSEFFIEEIGKQTRVENALFETQLVQIPDENALDFQDKNVAYFGAEKIKLPLKIRKWKTGDRFAPYGMGGKFKKVSDLFTDLKMDRFDKQAVLLLENGNGEIMWVIGVRTDERYKVKNFDQKVLSVRISKHF